MNMLELSEAQLAQLDTMEERQYLAALREKIVSEFPALAGDRSLASRLEQARRHALAMGFVDGPPITQFVYLEACAPGFYRQPAIHAWLTKPGKPVEQRFADLNALVKSTLREH